MKSKHRNTRPLLVDFDLYADNDPDFRQELIGLMIDNLEELQRANITSRELHLPEIYLKACHKVKTTLTMLADTEFISAVDGLKSDGTNMERIAVFNKLCSEIIDSLWAERIREPDN